MVVLIDAFKYGGLIILRTSSAGVQKLPLGSRH